MNQKKTQLSLVEKRKRLLKLINEDPRLEIIRSSIAAVRSADFVPMATKDGRNPFAECIKQPGVAIPINFYVPGKNGEAFQIIDGSLTQVVAVEPFKKPIDLERLASEIKLGAASKEDWLGSLGATSGARNEEAETKYLAKGFPGQVYHPEVIQSSGLTASEFAKLDPNQQQQLLENSQTVVGTQDSANVSCFNGDDSESASHPLAVAGLRGKLNDGSNWIGGDSTAADDLWELLRRFRDNDKLAFEQIVLRTSGSLYARLRALNFLFEDIEDICQEVYVKLAKDTTSGNMGFKFETFLKTIAVRVATDFRRRRNAEKRDERGDFSLDPANQSHHPSIVQCPLSKLAESEDFSTIVQLLDRLPENQGTAIALRYFEEWSWREIAEILGKSENAVQQLVARGLSTLRQFMSICPA